MDITLDPPGTGAVWAWAWLSGDLDTASSGTLRVILDQLRRVNLGYVVVDLSGLRILSTTGLNVLQCAVRDYAAAGGTLLLTRPTPTARRVLGLAGLGHLTSVTPLHSRSSRAEKPESHQMSPRVTR